MFQNKFHDKWRWKIFSTSLVNLLAVRFCFSSCYALLLVGLPLIMTRMNIDLGEIGLIMGSYAIGVLVGRPIASWLLCTSSRKLVAEFGALVICGSVLFFWAIPQPPLYGFFRFLQGMGSSLLITSTTTLAIDKTSVNHRGRFLSYLGMSHTAALIVGPFLAITLMDRTGSHVLFMSISILLLAGLGLLTRIDPSIHPEDFRLPAGQKELTALQGPIVVATVLLFLNSMVHGGVFYFFPLYLKDILAINGGLFFTCFAFAALSGRFVSGHISDQIGRKLVGFTAQSILILGVFLIGRVESMTSLIAAGVIYGIGFGAYMTAMTTFVSDRTNHDNRPLIIGIYFSALDIGNGLAGWLLGKVAEFASITGMLKYSLWISLTAGVVFLLFLIGDFIGRANTGRRPANDPSETNWSHLL